MSRKPTPVGGAAAPVAAPTEQAPPSVAQDAVSASADEPAKEEPATEQAPPSDPSEMVEVRVLRSEGGHAPNDVISLTSDEAMTAVLAGWADDDPAAVAAAREIVASTIV